MIVTFVHVWVKPEYIEAFKTASVQNHRQSIQEPGNFRFDVLQDADNPAKFVLYEAYEAEEAASAHKQTNHYKQWRETVADMMAQPRIGEKHVFIAPTSKA